MSVDPNRSEASRLFGLHLSLGLIDDYERDQLRIRALHPPHVRTEEEIRLECDQYRRDAHRVWGFPDGAGGRVGEREGKRGP